jgi:hypothetical protein
LAVETALIYAKIIQNTEKPKTVETALIQLVEISGGYPFITSRLRCEDLGLNLKIQPNSYRAVSFYNSCKCFWKSKDLWSFQNGKLLAKC